MKQAYIYETELGKLLIAQDAIGITDVTLLSGKEICTENAESGHTAQDYEFQETELIRETMKQLKEYLAGDRKEFTVKLNPQGTIFQEKVWKALLTIPYGETRSYKQIAEMVGNGKASRAVGMANHNNPVIVLIPCHRVIGANGTLVGYGGGLPLKEKLLKLEQCHRNV